MSRRNRSATLTARCDCTAVVDQPAPCSIEQLEQKRILTEQARLPERVVSRTIRGEALERRQPFQRLQHLPSVP